MHEAHYQDQPKGCVPSATEYSRHSLPFSDFSSVPDPEWLPELDWLPAEEGGASRFLSSSVLWVRSPLSELLSESLSAEREEEVLLVSLRGLRELRPGDRRRGNPCMD